MYHSPCAYVYFPCSLSTYPYDTPLLVVHLCCVVLVGSTHLLLSPSLPFTHSLTPLCLSCVVLCVASSLQSFEQSDWFTSWKHGRCTVGTGPHAIRQKNTHTNMTGGRGAPCTDGLESRLDICMHPTQHDHTYPFVCQLVFRFRISSSRW